MLRPQPIDSIPPETVRVAQAALPANHRYLGLANELGPLFTDDLFVELFPTHGQPARAPWRLALVTILQFAEGLSDRPAAAAVRSRIDWKYVLRLELTDPGFDASVLSEFRGRLLAGDAATLLFDTLLQWCHEHELVKAGGRQRTDSTHVLAAVRALNRIELVGEALRHALNTLAVLAPEWLAAVSPPEWMQRYARRAEDDRLPSKQAARDALVLTIGHDGQTLLAALDDAAAPTWLRYIPALLRLRQIWIQNYLWEGTQLQWRANDNIPPAARFISSPYDPDAHYARKGTTQWGGYKAHFTETCDDEGPPLLTHVETTPGPTADGAVTPRIHAALQQQDLLPKTHMVDTGFLDAELLSVSQAEYGVDLCGPTRADYHWQSQAKQGFAAHNFQLDWEQQQATCPAGKTRLSWSPAVDRGHNPVMKIKFSRKDCGQCAFLAQCVRSKKPDPRRTLTVRVEPHYAALQAARVREATPEFREEYHRRAGMEGTLSRGVRTSRLRRSPYVGLARTHLGQLLVAAGINWLRLGEWFAGRARPKTRRTPFMRLMSGTLAT